MLFGDQPYEEPPRSLKLKIIRAIQRVLQEGHRYQANLPIEYQIKRAVAAVVGTSIGIGAGGKSAYDWGISYYNSQGNAQATPDTVPALSSNIIRTGKINPKRLDMNKQEDEDMELAVALSEGMNSKETTSRSSGQASVVGGGETAITRQPAWYGFPETATVVLPYTSWYTVCTNSNQNVFGFYFRLNSTQDLFNNAIQADPTAGAALAAGIYRVKPGSGNNFSNPLLNYPTAGATGAGVITEGPQWRNYWEKIYNKYHVLGCEYELTFKNPFQGIDEDVVIMFGKEAISSANGGRVFPTNQPAHFYEYYPGLQWRICKSADEGKTDTTYTTIKGHYIPGSVKTNVQNDEDIKTWTDVGSVPTLQERMFIGIAQAGFNKSSTVRALNVRMKMKLIVQYKDINVNILYPNPGQTTFTTTFPTDILKIS